MAMRYVRDVITGHCEIACGDAPGTVEITEQEYNDYVNPPANVRLAKVLADETMTTAEKKRYMFTTMKHYLIDDGNLMEDESRPFHNPPMTVDEIQIEYQKYVGDDDERAEQLLQEKRAAKAYIRSLVEG